MLIMVTGAIGIGKSTICQKLVRIIQKSGYTCGGILTFKSEDGGIIIEDIQTTEKKTLASTDDLYHGPCTGKYYFNPEGINFGIFAIRNATVTDATIIDEMGHLELRGEGFAPVLQLIKEDRFRNCVLVIRKELLPEFSPYLPDKRLIFEATIENRDTLPQKIVSALLKELC